MTFRKKFTGRLFNITFILNNRKLLSAGHTHLYEAFKGRFILNSVKIVSAVNFQKFLMVYRTSGKK